MKNIIWYWLIFISFCSCEIIDLKREQLVQISSPEQSSNCIKLPITIVDLGSSHEINNFNLNTYLDSNKLTSNLNLYFSETGTSNTSITNLIPNQNYKLELLTSDIDTSFYFNTEGLGVFDDLVSFPKNVSTN